MCSFGSCQTRFESIQKSSKCVWVFRNTGANAFAKNQTRLAYEDKRDLYCSVDITDGVVLGGTCFTNNWKLEVHLRKGEADAL